MRYDLIDCGTLNTYTVRIYLYSRKRCKVKMIEVFLLYDYVLLYTDYRSYRLPRVFKCHGLKYCLCKCHMCSAFVIQKMEPGRTICHILPTIFTNNSLDQPLLVYNKEITYPYVGEKNHSGARHLG